MTVVLGTATPGGGFPVYGDAVAATLNEIDPSLGVVTRNTKEESKEDMTSLQDLVRRGREAAATATAPADPNNPNMIQPTTNRGFTPPPATVPSTRRGPAVGPPVRG